MFDGIRLYKKLGANAPNLDHLRPNATYHESGWEYYYIIGKYSFNMELRWNPNYKCIEVWGNPLYFWQGHNFTADIETYKEAINYISNIIKINLWDSTVKDFEYGTTFEVEENPISYISGHINGGGLNMWEKEKDKGAIRYFDDKKDKIQLKLYDVGKNIRDKHKKATRHLVESAGWNKDLNYIRFEVVYNAPDIALNNRLPLVLKDLFSENMIDTLNEDLYIQYKRIVKKQSIDSPDSKKELRTINVILYAFIKLAFEKGADPKKMLFKEINSYSNALLSKSDKDARRREINKLISNIKTSIISFFDLSSNLENTLSI